MLSSMLNGVKEDHFALLIPREARCCAEGHMYLGYEVFDSEEKWKKRMGDLVKQGQAFQAIEHDQNTAPRTAMLAEMFVASFGLLIAT